MGAFNEAIIYAVQKGYIVDGNGQVISPKGKKRALDSRGGYLRFSVKFEGVVRGIPVHRMVAYIKYGEKAFEPGVQVRHLNGNSLDCHKENIAIGTPLQNCLDIAPEIRVTRAKIAASKMRKLTDEEAGQIRRLNRVGVSLKKLATAYHVSKTAVSYIKNKKTYRGVEQSGSSSGS